MREYSLLTCTVVHCNYCVRKTRRSRSVVPAQVSAAISHHLVIHHQ